MLIEDRGVAVARISPVESDVSADADAVARLERQGIVRPAATPGPSRLALTPPPRPVRAVALSSFVAAEREAGW